MLATLSHESSFGVFGHSPRVPCRASTGLAYAVEGDPGALVTTGEAVAEQRTGLGLVSPMR